MTPVFSGAFISQWLRARQRNHEVDTLASTVAIGLALLAIAIGGQPR
ncbi:hypothetical protein [Enhygromyxa salina]|uniref:Uncharacterized protein n=1 Tax=Enhygromyxa salina TaxID=215803 RepID=A0A2S9YS95_9BACT|nr:hypothetical protein [Enhygromyxa salina]PRQ07909.1 hypothetical protein ENSA7_23480 [Enhygromyxa salina]